MKKLFIKSIALLSFALTICFTTFADESITLKSAFADGTCCPEDGSVCILNGKQYYSHYYKSSGSCGGGGEGFFDTPFR